MIQLASHVLANDDLSVQVVPELGGRITELTDLSNGRQWIWRNHRLPLGPVSEGTEYDAVWQGGVEELFPNDAPTVLDGLSLPDHGELWSVAWNVKSVTESSIALSVTGPTTGVEIEKMYELNGPDLRIHYRLTHPGDSELPHMFKLHPALDIHEDCHIGLPGGQVEKVDPDFGNLLDSTVPQLWPTDADLSRCRPKTSRTNEFVYVSELPDGRCKVVDERAGSWIRIDYETDAFPYCWLFMSYGGWRDHNVLVLEPCTNYPKDLIDAMERGTSAVFAPGETKEFEVTFSMGSADG